MIATSNSYGPPRTIGSKLRRLENKQRLARWQRQQRVFNKLMTGLMILLVGVGIGYGWSRLQMASYVTVPSHEWTNNIDKERR